MTDNNQLFVIVQGKQNEWFDKDIIITGHKKGIIKIWNKTLEPKPVSDNGGKKGI